MRALLGLVIALLVGLAPVAVLVWPDPAGASAGRHSQIGDVPASEAPGSRLDELLPDLATAWQPIATTRPDARTLCLATRRLRPAPFRVGSHAHARPGRAHAVADPAH